MRTKTQLRLDTRFNAVAHAMRPKTSPMTTKISFRPLPEAQMNLRAPSLGG
jgi:hypothetical protein